MSLTDEITAAVKKAILDSSGRDLDLSPGDALLSSGYLDSLTLMQLFVTLQTDFGVELEPQDMTEENFGTSESIAKLVEERRG